MLPRTESTAPLAMGLGKHATGQTNFDSGEFSDSIYSVPSFPSKNNAILAVNRPSLVGLIWHSHTVRAFHPIRLNSRRFLASRALLPASLFTQNALRVAGTDCPLRHACRCQKQPWTNTTLRMDGKTRSGESGEESGDAIRISLAKRKKGTGYFLLTARCLAGCRVLPGSGGHALATERCRMAPSRWHVAGEEVPLFYLYSDGL